METKGSHFPYSLKNAIEERTDKQRNNEPKNKDERKMQENKATIKCGAQTLPSLFT